ncbi:class I SAM-dependent methyltransferase [Saccharopolyspora phatthalungensis]|uniref:SAM-dependent methyltransferase n=1 Tax=Saccharopolyspora phatthalungensis TaxID=664693 RepID=A0A840Q110_9PSEU|nr:class I SAM-dependent methyltransferase [Saccharopolyspora phatthalungensis]MBB5154044.1 SAM-dependent methyltransferase [Saccharopolyspora phatthalungensis]
MTSDDVHAVRPAVTVTCHYKRAGVLPPEEMLERFRVLAGKRAAGRVLDIGAFRLEDLLAYRHVCYLAMLDAKSELRGERPDLSVDFVDGDPANLPFPDRAFDVVVCRFSLCSTAKPESALVEICRVLRPVGQLLFLEHTRAPGVVGQAQDRAQEMLHGCRRCRLNVEVLAQVQRAGLVVRRADWYWPSAHVRAPLVQGVATHPDPQYRRELAWLRNPIRKTGEPLWPGR